MARTVPLDTIYLIDFYNAAGNPLATSTIEAPGYWEAALEGHAMLYEGSISGAEEFQLTEMRMI